MLDGTTWRVPSLRHKVSAEEWQARVDCAALSSARWPVTVETRCMTWL